MTGIGIQSGPSQRYCRRWLIIWISRVYSLHIRCDWKWWWCTCALVLISWPIIDGHSSFAGRSRSAAVVLAYLMYSQKITSENALKILKKAKYVTTYVNWLFRGDVQPNLGFLRQLDLFYYCGYNPMPNTTRHKLYKLEIEAKKKIPSTTTWLEPADSLTETIMNVTSGIDPLEISTILPKLERNTMQSYQFSGTEECLYACPHCSRLLFTELSVKLHKSGCSEGTIFVEIINWMPQQMSAEHCTIACPQCQNTIANFDWCGTTCQQCQECFQPAVKMTTTVKKLPVSLLWQQ